MLRSALTLVFVPITHFTVMVYHHVGGGATCRISCCPKINRHDVIVAWGAIYFHCLFRAAQVLANAVSRKPAFTNNVIFLTIVFPPLET